MARMMPLHISEDNPSPAERELFDEFENACSDDWTVLHSLDVARRWKNRPFGEADFVVLVPGAGILCLEAKTYVYRDAQGMWQYEPNGPATEKSPFDQANGAMWAILEWLRGRGADPVLAAAAVVVPDMDVRIDQGASTRSQIEWCDWQLIDRQRYRSRSLEQHVLDCLDAQRRTLSNPPPPMSREQAVRITRMLRAEVECYESPRARIERQFEEAKRYTDEQFQVLDLVGGNQQLVVDGLAGTGKTLLAIECARRAVEDGKRVLLACFNSMLGDWLKQETEPLGERCVARTLHAYMRDLVGDCGAPPLDDEHYWERTLPSRAIEVLTDPAANVPAFDVIVLDEAQDILGNSAYLDVLDAALAQGLGQGRWILLGDFAKQAIYIPFAGAPHEALAARIGHQPALVRLDKNCRNTPRVAHAAGAIAAFAEGEGYRRVLRDDDGREPTVLYYSGAKTREKRLIEALDLLLLEGFKPGEIAALSRRSVRSCTAATIDTAPWRDRLRPFEESDGTHTGYDSIYRFKGREAQAVVLCDIDAIEDWREGTTEDDVRSLLYVGATRSLGRVMFVAHESWQSMFDFGPMDEFAVTEGDLAAAADATSRGE